ncbi:MAG: tetratricopeptide (TPR) repeat protein [Myxococcota bacterium]|jgi:tetratricopeptide (TPR) repeat protein
MKCQFCHGKVKPGEAKCPHCGWDIPQPPPVDKRLIRRDRKNYPRSRKLWIGLIGLAFGVGIFARAVGPFDSSPRYRARDEAAEGLQALHSGRFELARDRLHIALRHDDQFAEGWLALGLASLATGRYGEARENSTRALELLRAGDVDPQAWSGKVTGRLRADLIGDRTVCVAEVASTRALPAKDAARVYEIMFDVLQQPDCAGAESALRRFNDGGDAYQVIIASMAACPGHWRCSRAPVSSGSGPTVRP